MLTGCGTKNPVETPGVTVIVQTPIPSAYPNPAEEPTVPVVTFAYPGPLGGSGISETVPTPEYYVTEFSRSDTRQWKSCCHRAVITWR